MPSGQYTPSDPEEAAPVRGCQLGCTRWVDIGATWRI